MNSFILKIKNKPKYRDPYITPEAFRICKKKFVLWKQYTESLNHIDYVHYSTVRNKLRLLIRTLKKEYEAQLSTNLRNNPKAFWKYISTKLKTKCRVDSLQKDDGSIAELDQEKAGV